MFDHFTWAEAIYNGVLLLVGFWLGWRCGYRSRPVDVRRRMRHWSGE